MSKSPWISTTSALRNITYTSEITREGQIYTLSDARWPELFGWRIRMELVHGIDVLSWEAPPEVLWEAPREVS